jgi:hypothetical protein
LFKYKIRYIYIKGRSYLVEKFVLLRELAVEDPDFH